MAKLNVYHPDGTPKEFQPGAVTLAEGGTGSNLSATGPGAVVQTALGANFSVETLDETRGGTGQSTLTTGDMLYASAGNVFSKLAIGTTNYILRVVAGIPAWGLEFYNTIKKAGSAVTQRGILNFIDGANISVTVADDSGGAKTDVTVAATGLATTALDNLASVAVNTSIISDTDNTDDLGSAAKKWANIWTNLLGLKARTAPSTPATNDAVIYMGQDKAAHLLDELALDSVLAKSQPASYIKFADNATNNMISKTIKANSMGANGWARIRLHILVLNNKGTSGTYTIIATFGATSITLVNAQNINNGGQHLVTVDFLVTNRNAASGANSQWLSTLHTLNNTITTTPSAVAITSAAGGAGSNDTTTDMTMKVTCALNATNAAFTSEAIDPIFEGPYYNA